MSVLTSRAASALVTSAALLALGVPAVQAQTWSGPATGGDWNTAANWTPGTVPNAVGAAAVFNDSTASRTVTFSNTSTIGSLTIHNNTAFVNNIGAVGGPVLNFDVASGDAGVVVTGTAPGAATNANALRGIVQLNDQTIFDLAPRIDYNTTALVIGIGGNDVRGTGGITKNGAGVLSVVDSDKSYEGPTVVNDGRLRFNATAFPAATSGVTVNPGGQLVIERAGTLTFGGNASKVVSIGGLGYAYPPAGRGVQFAGAIRMGSNLVQTITNPLFLQAGDTGVGMNGALANLTFSNVISGPGRFVMNPLGGNPLDQGVQVFTADNAYTGGTVVQLGTLQVNPGSDLGTGDVIVDGRTVQAPGVNSPFANDGVATGKLLLKTGVTNAIDDAAILTLTGDDTSNGGGPDGAPGGYAILEAGVIEQVFGLVLGTTPQPPGLYTASNAAPYIQGSGAILVVPEPATLSLIALGGLGRLARRRRRRPA